MGDFVPNNFGLVPEEAACRPDEDLASTDGAASPAAWRRVFRYAYSLVGNRDEAEDLTQEAFVVLFREKRAGRPVEQVGAWMRTVTKHLAYRRYHEQRPDLHVSLDAVNQQTNRVVFDPVDPAPSIEKKIIDDGLLRLGAKILYEFPEKDRECILMYFRGYDFIKIAAAQGVSRWTARRNTLKALRKLQTRVDRSRA
jgi:RNA polymerase sigma-70 factor, ECF subfamily